MLIRLFLSPLAVEQESSARLDVGNHIILVDIGFVVASYEVSLVDEVGRLDRSLTETQVRYSYAARLLRVVSEICLCIQVGVVADDLDGVLVSANGTICTQTPELAGGSAGRSGVEP